MVPITPELVANAVNLIGDEVATDDEVEARVLVLAGDAMLARRLIDWIREAFGTVLVSHLGKIEFSKTFSAQDAHGRWHSIPYSEEPIFAAAVIIGQSMLHDGPRAMFQKIACHSSVFNSVNNALNAGASLNGATTSGPALIGIPAEVYSSVKASWSRRFFYWLGRLSTQA